jgi:tetratricopeptide (TPR) repeat protein
VLLLHAFGHASEDPLGQSAGYASSDTAGQEASDYERTALEIQKQLEGGNLEQARGMIIAAQQKFPHHGGLENLLGVVEIREDHAADAIRAFQAAIRDSPRLVGAYLNLSRIRMGEAATDKTARAEALRLSRKVLEMDPGNDEACYQTATIYLWNGDYRLSLEQVETLSPGARAQVGAEALVCADRAALGPRASVDEAAKSLAANADLTEQDVDTCLPALRAARRADLIQILLDASGAHQALSPQGLRVLGLAEEANGRLKEARATLESAFAANSGSVSILEDLTRVATAAGDDQGALGYLAHARDLEPHNADLPYEFGVICVRMGLLAEARKAIAEALRLKPDDARYNLGMGIVVSFSEDPSQSLPYLAKFHALQPKDPQGPLALGEANFRAKDYDTAMTWFHQAVDDERTAADAHYYMGRIARQQGQLEEAAAELKQALALRPGNADTLAELGQVSLAKHDFAPAEAYFEQALRLDADNYAANFGLLQLYARTGDARREQQAHRFDEVKKIRDERDQQMMRAIEVRPDGGAARPE